MQAGNQALQNAGSVLIIGAGPSGIETAAEIAKAMPGKLVTLVDSSSNILPEGTPASMVQHVLKWLKRHGVKVRPAYQIMAGVSAALGACSRSAGSCIWTLSGMHQLVR